MRLRIEDGGCTLSIEYRCEKHEVQDIKSFFFNFTFLVSRMLLSQINAIDVLTSISASNFNHTQRSNVARNCQRVIYIFYLLRKSVI